LQAVTSGDDGSRPSSAVSVLDNAQLSAPLPDSRSCESHGTFEDFGLKERLHQPVVDAVAQRLGFVAHGGGVVGGV
jgi:hypothetical protein